MRILICTGIFPPDIGGPATYSKLLADELPKYEIKSEVLSFGEARKFPKLIRHFVYFLKVLRRGREANIIFAQDPVSVGLPSLLAAKILGKKFILKIVGDYAWEQGMQRFGVKDLLDEFLDKKYGWRVEILRKIQKFVAKNAAIIIVPSEYLKRVIFKWGIPADKIRVVYNAVEKPRQIFSAVSRDFILSVGRLVPWKGFGTLIEIMKELPKEIKLIIIGSGPEYYNLKFKIENLKLNEQVKLIQQLPHEKSLDYFTKAKIFILNTAYEGLPHVVLEAMAYGAPVIATNVGGNPEVIKNNYNGFLVDYDNKNQLKDAILKLWSDEELRQKFADNSFKESEKFSLDKMIKETIKVLSL